jgi:hypothetical protein
LETLPNWFQKFGLGWVLSRTLFFRSDLEIQFLNGYAVLFHPKYSVQ